MKHLKTRFLVLCAVVALAAASLAPIVARAQCPIINVPCGNGTTTHCSGTPQGTGCVYDRGCLNGGKCHGVLAEVEGDY